MVNLALARAYRARHAYSAVMSPIRLAVATRRTTTGYPAARPPAGAPNTPVPPPRQFSAADSVADPVREWASASVSADIANASTNRGVCAHETRRTSPSVMTSSPISSCSMIASRTASLSSAASAGLARRGAGTPAAVLHHDPAPHGVVEQRGVGRAGPAGGAAHRGVPQQAADRVRPRLSPPRGDDFPMIGRIR